MNYEQYPCKGCKNEYKVVNGKKATCVNYTCCRAFKRWFAYKWNAVCRPLREAAKIKRLREERDRADTDSQT